VKKGSIVQIIDEKHSWYPCLLIVDEVKTWGVQAVAIIPQSNDGSAPVSRAWNRLNYEQIKEVGLAEIISS